MSSADPRYAARAAFVALALASAAMLGGCGFQPLYGGGSGGRVQAAMAAVEIAPIPTRVGQRLRNELIFAKTGGGAQAPSQYRLEVSIRESVIDQAVQISGEVGAQIYQLQAEFRLYNASDNSVLLEGNAVSNAPFDRVESVFANVRARVDAENRAANVVSETIKTRLAAYLSRAA
jgi:LPS-assembly lipoprotein